MTNCSDAFDCPIGQLCFPSNQQNSDGVCDCNPWYGWSGEDCDEESAQVVYQRVFLFSILLLEAVTISLALYTFAFRQKAVWEHKKKNRNLTFFLILMNLLTILGSVFITLGVAFQIPAAYDPTVFKVQVYSFGFGRTVDSLSKYDALAHSFFVCALITLVITGTLILQSWLALVGTLAKDFPDLIKEQEAKQKQAHFVFIPTLVMFYIITLVLQQWHLIVYATVGGTLFFSVALIPGLYKLILRPLSAEFVGKTREKEFKEVYNFFMFVHWFQIASSLFGISIQFIAFMLFVHKDEILKPGQFNYIGMFRDIFVICLSIYPCFYIWYMNRIITNLESANSSGSTRRMRASTAATARTLTTNIKEKQSSVDVTSK